MVEELRPQVEESPSPIRAEHHRSTTPSAAASTAMPATTNDRVTIRGTSPPSTPSSMICLKRIAGATPSAEPMTTVMRNTVMRLLKGAPYPSTRRTIPLGSSWFLMDGSLDIPPMIRAPP